MEPPKDPRNKSSTRQKKSLDIYFEESQKPQGPQTFTILAVSSLPGLSSSTISNLSACHEHENI